jgi:outer membrane protein assembly factor BamB
MRAKQHLSWAVAAGAVLIALVGFTGCNNCTSCTITPIWDHYRGSTLRGGFQLFADGLADANQVNNLHVGWPSAFHPQNAGAFYASPIVYHGKVYIGNSNGYFYCVDSGTGHQSWVYPRQDLGEAPLVQQFIGNPSSHGIASSAAIGIVGSTTAVIFGAPDTRSGGFGDGHLFALNADTGTLIWESDTVAHLTGLTSGSTSEMHEQIGYSAPLVWNNHIYIGIADHGDNPIQNGKVVAVRLADGHIDPGFSFSSTSTRGGGVWSSVAAFDTGLFVTTGNSRCWNGGCQSEPNPNRGLSLLRLDQNTGAVVWQLQPVPFALDDDPDWASGPTVTLGGSPVMVVSTPKDGWTWAVATDPAGGGGPNVLWSFPPGPWTHGGFHPGDGTVHGDDPRYLKPGAAWGGVYVGSMGGYDTMTALAAGLQRLTALNVSASDAQRVRWIKDIPGTTPFGSTYPLGPVTVTQQMYFVGTNMGHVVAIADPDIHPALGNRCEDPEIPSPSCVASGHRLVPDPWIKDVALPAGSSDGIFGEPALAEDRVFVATVAGNVYMLEP